MSGNILDSHFLLGGKPLKRIQVLMHLLVWQEALFEAGVRRLGDIDHLDPGVKGDTKV